MILEEDAKDTKGIRNKGHYVNKECLLQENENLKGLCIIFALLSDYMDK